MSGYIINRKRSGNSITCLACNLTSYHPDDVTYLFCGKCNKYHGKPRPTSLGVVRFRRARESGLFRDMFDEWKGNYSGPEFCLDGTSFYYSPATNKWSYIEIDGNPSKTSGRSFQEHFGVETEDVINILKDTHPEVAEKLIYNLNIFTVD